MALHKTHELFNLFLLPPLLILVPEQYRPEFAVGYLLSTFILSPDIDLYFSKPSSRWGVLRFLWLPFWIFSKHRGITHIPFLGTFIKLFYLCLVFLFLYFSLLGLITLFGFEGKFLISFDPFRFLEELFGKESTFWFFLGVLAADLLHLFLDWGTSFIKRLRRSLL